MQEKTTSDQLARSIDGLFGVGDGVTVILLDQILEYDSRELYKEDGSCTMEDWISYRRGCSKRTARGYVDLARRLVDLPKIKEALAGGSLSFDKALEISKVATAEDEDYWVEEGQTNSFARVEFLVRLARRITRREVSDLHSARGVWFRPDGRGLVNIRARLPEADSALVRKALEHITKEMGPDNPDGTYNCERLRKADALIELASVSLGHDAEPDTPQVVCHVDIRDLNKIHGTAILEEGGVLGSEVARRLACDSKLQMVINMPNGDVYAISRNSRTVPRWQRRLLMKRDKGCRFADCGRTRGLVPHHIIHWAHGGETILENLVMLCPYHHHLVHEGGWRIVLDSQLRMRFVRPNGAPLNYRPVPLRESVRQRVFGPPPPSAGPGRQLQTTGPRK